MTKEKFQYFLIGGILLGVVNSISFFTLDQPIGVGGFMGWIPSALVALCDEAQAQANMMFSFFYYDTEAAPCVGIGLCVVIGSFLYTMKKRRFKIRFFGPGMWIRAFLGGCLMGFSFPMMRGCNIIHIFAGIPQVALSAFVAIGGMILGAYIGRKLLSLA
ncbi:YeeE/YedE thiosulfate transporter family protein [Acidobacteriota bacterium]